MPRARDVNESIGKVGAGPSIRMTTAVELMRGLIFALVLAVCRLEVRAQFTTIDRSVILFGIAGAATAATALVAARRTTGAGSWVWMIVAAAAIVWEPGRAAPDGVHRDALAAINGGFIAAAALLSVALSLALHVSTNAAERQKLALDLIPQLAGLIAIVWIAWIGPQALDGPGGRFAGAIIAGHGLVDVLLIGLCVAGTIGRRQGVASEPPVGLLAGVALLSLGDIASLPLWEQSGAVRSTSAQGILGAGLAFIALAAVRAWRLPFGGRPATVHTPTLWASQLPNFVLICLLLVAAGQVLFGERVVGGVALAIGAGIVVISFGMVRQSLTLRSERRLHEEIEQLNGEIDGLVSQVGRDPLTGLLNHRAMHARLEQEIGRARALGAGLAVALVDVDNFKSINDQRGHQAGDRVLRAISSILIAACRGTDVAARYAGDEFMLIFPGLDEAHAAVVCQRIVEEVRRVNQYLNLGKDLAVTLSIGVAAARGWSQGSAKIIGVADAAMYDAKENGKDQVVVVNADTMVALNSTRRMDARDGAIPPGGLPFMPALRPSRDRRRFSRFERAS